MLWLYRLLFPVAALVSAPFYLRRMARRGGYGRDFGHRFGGYPVPAPTGRPRVWIQAVSVGEMLALGPLLQALQADGVEIHLTTTTSTGYALARERYAGLVAGIGYFPLDAWPCMARAWRRLRPDLALLLEGERWPEFLHQAARRGVPVLNLNARLSDRSHGRLRRLPFGRGLLFRGLTRLLAVSAEDAARFRGLGMPGERILVTGNIKLDVRLPALAEVERAALRRELGLPSGLILLGSSTWPGEEAALLAAWRSARAAGIEVGLLLVPRHAERRAEVEAAVRAAGATVHLRSRGPAPGPVNVAVADTTGELRRLTPLADLVFVGKSLPPHTEGQTPVEAAALGRPILVGPGMANFRPIVRELLAAGAVRPVASAEDLAAVVPTLLADPAARGALAAAAQAWHRENAGAVDRTLAVVREELRRLRRNGEAHR